MLPPRLYKYQRVDANSLSNLRARKLWFAAPHRFNDPFDCALQVIAPELDEKDLDRAVKYLRGRARLKQEFEAQMIRDGRATPEFAAILRQAIEGAYAERRQVQLEQRGTVCLSARNDHILMWSHYADGHRGLCLEFSTSEEPFAKARPVEYSSVVPSINAMDLLERDDGVDLFKALILTKHSCWSYEEEYRLLHAEADKVYGYHHRLLTAVYFGAKMPQEHRSILATLLHGSGTRLFEMHISPREFACRPQSVTYIPPTYE
jgi:hypothetical protein